eukprot:12917200-Prorocentrum_lima.AAC.1
MGRTLGPTALGTSDLGGAGGRHCSGGGPRTVGTPNGDDPIPYEEEGMVSPVHVQQRAVTRTMSQSAT